MMTISLRCISPRKSFSIIQREGSSLSGFEREEHRNMLGNGGCSGFLEEVLLELTEVFPFADERFTDFKRIMSSLFALSSSRR